MATVVIVLKDDEKGLELEFKSDEPISKDDVKSWTSAQTIGMLALQHIDQHFEEMDEVARKIVSMDCI